MHLENYPVYPEMNKFVVFFLFVIFIYLFFYTHYIP